MFEQTFKNIDNVLWKEAIANTTNQTTKPAQDVNAA
jgi:hypothetical protein